MIVIPMDLYTIPVMMYTFPYLIYHPVLLSTVYLTTHRPQHLHSPPELTSLRRVVSKTICIAPVKSLLHWTR